MPISRRRSSEAPNPTPGRVAIPTVAVPASTIAWLLEPDNPPVALRTRTEVLGENERSRAVRQVRARLMDYAVTRGILAQGEAFWHDDDRAYAKYTGLYWQLIFLGWFLADGTTPEIAAAVERLLETRRWVTPAGGQCLTANLLAAFRRLGYGDHPVVHAETEALAERWVADGGVRCSAMDYSLLRHCHMALPKLLLCFALVPEAERSKAVRDAIALAAEQLLEREVFVYVPGNRGAWTALLETAPRRAELPEGQTVKGWIAERREAFLRERGPGEPQEKTSWTRFGFPLHYNSDVLEASYALARVGTPLREELRRPLERIADRAGPGARWTMERSLNGKMLVDVERKGAPSKWLTFFALSTLRHFGRLERV